MITIKVREGFDEIPVQRGTVTFGINSLDDLSEQFELSSIKKQFKYNPAKLRDDLPDLSRIYQIDFPARIDVHSVAEAFSRDPNIEYAEPIPIVGQLAEIPNDELLYVSATFTTDHAPKQPGISIIVKMETEEVVIGIVDDCSRMDIILILIDNMWQNLGEDFDGDGYVLEFNGSEWVFDPGDINNIDDDGNGYIDDFIGWDFYLWEF